MGKRQALSLWIWSRVRKRAGNPIILKLATERGAMIGLYQCSPASEMLSTRLWRWSQVSMIGNHRG